MPAVMKTMSALATMLVMFTRDSSAAAAPSAGFPPVPEAPTPACQ
jgi:hypothetical protein